MTITDTGTDQDASQWQLQVQIVRTAPVHECDPAQQWVARIDRPPATPAGLCALLRQAATDIEGDGQAAAAGGGPHPYLALIDTAEVIAAADDLGELRQVLRDLHDPHAGHPNAAVVYAAALGRAQAVLAELAGLARRLAALR